MPFQQNLMTKCDLTTYQSLKVGEMWPPTSFKQSVHNLCYLPYQWTSLIKYNCNHLCDIQSVHEKCIMYYQRTNERECDTPYGVQAVHAYCNIPYRWSNLMMCNLNIICILYNQSTSSASRYTVVLIQWNKTDLVHQSCNQSMNR